MFYVTRYFVHFPGTELIPDLTESLNAYNTCNIKAVVEARLVITMERTCCVGYLAVITLLFYMFALTI